MTSIEEKIRDERYWRIGWAIMRMNRWERLWWGITGRHRYMNPKSWDRLTYRGKL